MRLTSGHIELFVQNPLKSREFYEKSLGFQVQEIQQEQFVWMELGSLTLLLRPGTPSNLPDTYQETSSGIVLYTDNLERTRDELQERGVEFKGTDGSERCLTFTDPDGNWFQLVDPANH
ncbi:MAG: VOC family protein [Candidatus Kapaibacterium sp.]